MSGFEHRSFAPHDRPPPGLTGRQATRLLGLFQKSSSQATSYLYSLRPELHRGERAFAEVMLWATRQGFRGALDVSFAGWKEHLTDQERLLLLDRSKAGPTRSIDSPDHVPPDDPLDIVHDFQSLHRSRREDVRALVERQEHEAAWSEGRLLGFRLMAWLDGEALGPGEVRRLVARLASAHLGDPDRQLPDLDGFSRAGAPYTPRSLALALGSMDGWREALMDAEDQAETSLFARLVDIFEPMSLCEAERFLVDYDVEATPPDLEALEAFLRRKEASPTELVRVAQSLLARRAGSPRPTPSRLVDILCLLASEGGAPAEVDALITFSIVDPAWTTRYLQFFERLSPERRRALVEHDLGAPDATGGGILGVAVDPALEPLLEGYAKRGTVPGTFLRAASARLGQSALACPPERGKPWDRWRDWTEELREAFTRTAAVTMVRREASPLLLRWHPRHPRVTQLLQVLGRGRQLLSILSEVIPYSDDPRTLLEVVAARLADLPFPDHQHAVIEAIRRFQEAAPGSDLAFLPETWRRGVAAEPPREPTFAERLARLVDLARRAPGPVTPIYVIEVQNEVSARAKMPLSRLNGPAPGPAVGEGYAHALSLDLEQIPELAARYPGARVLSLLVPRDEEGSCEEESASTLRALPADAVAPAVGVGARYRPIGLHRVLVPGATFDGPTLFGDSLDEKVGPLRLLYDELRSHDGWVLGEALDFNGDPDDLAEGPSESFVLTISESVIAALAGDRRLRVYRDRVSRDR
ncbi:MAG: hypothetical protein ABJE95_02060 [Byssovorax sp.]